MTNISILTICVSRVWHSSAYSYQNRIVLDSPQRQQQCTEFADRICCYILWNLNHAEMDTLLFAVGMMSLPHAFASLGLIWGCCFMFSMAAICYFGERIVARYEFSAIAGCAHFLHCYMLYYASKYILFVICTLMIVLTMEFILVYMFFKNVLMY